MARGTVALLALAMAGLIWAQDPNRPTSSDPLVPLLDAKFQPKAMPDPTMNQLSSADRSAFEQHAAGFTQLPSRGAGFEAIGTQDIFWGCPEVVNAFMAGAKEWSLGGGSDLQVYCFSARNPAANMVENDQGTWGHSKVYGSRDPRVQKYDYACDPFNVTGTVCDLREYQSDAMNTRLEQVLTSNGGKYIYIWDALTKDDIRTNHHPVSSPMHVSYVLHGDLDNFPSICGLPGRAVDNYQSARKDALNHELWGSGSRSGNRDKRPGQISKKSWENLLPKDDPERDEDRTEREEHSVHHHHR